MDREKGEYIVLNKTGDDLYGFYWCNVNTGQIFFMHVSISNIRFEIDEALPEPICRFRWRHPNPSFKLDQWWYNSIIYVLVKGKSKHILVPSCES